MKTQQEIRPTAASAWDYRDAEDTGAPTEAATLGRSTRLAGFPNPSSLCADLPDIRADRVAEIRARLAAGAYDFSAEALADAILAGADRTGVGSQESGVGETPCP